MKLIDKAAVIAEVDKLTNSLLKSCNPNPLGTMIECLSDAEIEALSIVKDSIEGINTKEVDLENEITDYINRYYHIRFDETLERGNDPLTTKDFEEIAKYFFELGLKQSSDEVKIGESQIYLNDDGGEPPYDGKQWLDLSCTEYEIPSDKFQDGDKIEIVIRKIKKGK